MTTHNIQKPFIPASYIFSYWILVWGIFYVSALLFYQFVKKSKMPSQIQMLNPALVILVALIWNTLSLIKFVVTGKSWWIIFKYGLMIVLIKAIPLWFLWQNYLESRINGLRDVALFLSVFAVYCAYLWINDTDVFSVYDELTVSEENDENRTPFEYWFTRLVMFGANPASA